MVLKNKNLKSKKKKPKKKNSKRVSENIVKSKQEKELELDEKLEEALKKVGEDDLEDYLEEEYGEGFYNEDIESRIRDWILANNFNDGNNGVLVSEQINPDVDLAAVTTLEDVAGEASSTNEEDNSGGEDFYKSISGGASADLYKTDEKSTGYDSIDVSYQNAEAVSGVEGGDVGVFGGRTSREKESGLQTVGTVKHEPWNERSPKEGEMNKVYETGKTPFQKEEEKVEEQARKYR